MIVMGAHDVRSVPSQQSCSLEPAAGTCAMWGSAWAAMSSGKLPQCRPPG